MHILKNEFLIHFILSFYKGIFGIINQLFLVEVECLVNVALMVFEVHLPVLQLPYPIEDLQHVDDLHIQIPQPLPSDSLDHFVDTPEKTCHILPNGCTGTQDGRSAGTKSP